MIPLPILIAAGAVVLLGGKKKSASAKSSKCDPNAESPKGFVCKNGVLRAVALDRSTIEKARNAGADKPAVGLFDAVDESVLEIEEVDNTGEFEISEEDVSIGADEEMGDLAISYNDNVIDQRETCREFLEAIYVVPSDDGELALNDVAAVQTAIPAMKSVLLRSSGPVDLDDIGPQMVLAALTDLVPVCKWEYSNGDFTYGDGNAIESDAGKEVLYALMKLSGIMVDEFNAVGARPAT